MSSNKSLVRGRNGFAIGGHRGFGENLLDRSKAEPMCPGIRENTMASFNAACELDADFVEFDVQVTSDGVPVIFHDPYIVHGSLCTPKRSLVSELTLAEVRQITHFFRWFKDSKTLARLPCDFAWHCEHEDMPAPTLEELFNQLPEDMSFNIEIKMATSAALQHTPLTELRRVVDPIIAVIKNNAGSRKVAVSSFDPDVMAYFEEHRRLEFAHLTSLSAWFLTEGPKEMLRTDPRRLSVSAAAAFAKQAQLTGIVVESSVAAKHLTEIEEALASGLQVMTYGPKNNEPAWVLQQRAMGIHGVIVDDVASIVDSMSEAAGGSPVSSIDLFPLDFRG